MSLDSKEVIDDGVQVIDDGVEAEGDGAQGDDTDWHDLRFRGVSLLFGEAALPRLRSARAAVLGIGGVGSWVVEGIARSGFGGLTLVDLDDICISNTNRQLHTLTDTVGRPKVDVMAERVRQINPECRVDTVHDFFAQETADAILDRYPPRRKWGVTCVSSPEQPKFVPREEEGEGGPAARRTCDTGYGTFCPAAGALGFALAAAATRIVLAGPEREPGEEGSDVEEGDGGGPP